MSRKNILAPYKVESAHSLAASFNSAPTIISYLDNCAYQINIATTNSIGNFFIQGSIDYQIDVNQNVINAGNWVDLSLGGGNGQPAAAAANDSIIVDLNQLPYNAIRVRYAAGTAGTGVCDIWVTLKQVGG